MENRRKRRVDVDLEKEKVIKYIMYESSISVKRTLLSSFIMILIVSLPSAIFGVYANITKIIFLPLIIVFCIWIVYLLKNTKGKRKQYILFLGLVSFFISISFMILAFNFASTIMTVKLIYIIGVAFFYILANTFYILNVLRLIKKDYYQKQGKTESPYSIIFPMAILGLGIGKSLYSVSQEKIVLIIVACMLFMAFLFSIGIHNLLRYYYIKIFDERLKTIRY